MPSVELELKQIALAGGCKAVGIAPAADFAKYAPEGYRPQDILAGAKSVVVFGGPTYWTGAWKSQSPRIRAMARKFGNARKALASKIADAIETKFDHFALPYDGETETNFVPYMSLKLCAELAGLGTRSMAAGIILNKDFGLLNLGAVVTTMPLTPDSPLSEPVCPDKSCWQLWQKEHSLPCLDGCPTCLSGELEDGRIKHMEYRRNLCHPYAQTTSTAAFQRILVEIVEEPDAGRRKALALGSFFSRVIKSLASGQELVGNCGDCIRFCPVYVRARTPKNN